MRVNRNAWRVSYDNEKLLQTTALELLLTMKQLNLSKKDAMVVCDSAKLILVLKDVDIRKRAITKIVYALKRGNESCQIHAIWIADIFLDYVSQQNEFAFKFDRSTI